MIQRTTVCTLLLCLGLSACWREHDIGEWTGFPGAPTEGQPPQGNGPQDAGGNRPDGGSTPPDGGRGDGGTADAGVCAPEEGSPGTWKTLAEIPSNASGEYAPIEITHVVDEQGRPVVAWTEGTQHIQGPDWTYLHVSRWDGGGWTQLGTSLNGSDTLAHAQSPAIAMRAGHLVVAWVGTAPGSSERDHHVHVRSFNGSSWEAVGDPAQGIGTFRFPSTLSLALDSTGAPLVAVTSEALPLPSAIYVLRWSRAEGTWTVLGGMPLSFRRPDAWRGLSPSLMVDFQDDPQVAWREDYPRAEGTGVNSIINVSRWNSGTQRWSFMGESLSSVQAPEGTHNWSPSIAVDKGGQPVVAWQGGRPAGGSDVHVRQWEGRRWAAPGGGRLNYQAPLTAYPPLVRVDGRNRLVAVWPQQTTPNGLGVLTGARYECNAWKRLGSNELPTFRMRALGLNGSGTPLVSGMDEGSPVGKPRPSIVCLAGPDGVCR